MDWNLDSGEIDRTLGFRISEIERMLLFRALETLPGGDHHSWGAHLHRGNQTWVGLDPETIQTPYQELLRLCQKLPLKKNDQVIDLGAGYGRLGIVIQKVYPDIKFRGIEFVPERVIETKRVYSLLGISPDVMNEGDLTAPDFFPGEADHYFVYDFGKVPHIRQLLNKLSQIADRKKFTLTGRGKGIRSLIAHEFLWLTPVYEEENFSIYNF